MERGKEHTKSEQACGFFGTSVPSASNVRIILQARTTSRRLPAKVLLPLGRMPLVVLCAKRAGNTGIDLRVATSTDSSDDELVAQLEAAGIRTVRGPLDDVLGRFLLAASDLDDRDIVIRLTSDNPFPDGALLREMANALTTQALHYLCTHSPSTGLPYGLSAEAFTTKVLREAAREAQGANDREHVTPWIRRQYGAAAFRPSGSTRDYSHLRCTIDNMDDYLRALAVFKGIDDPTGVLWQALCERLAALPGAPRCRVPWRASDEAIQSELVLGTAQLGMLYGATNTTGQPSLAEAERLIETAVSHGVTSIDTGRAYGMSEQIIGRTMDRLGRTDVIVVTKLDPLDHVPPDTPAPLVRDAVRASVFRSCRELRQPRLDVLLLHRWAHRTAFDGTAWGELRALQQSGVIGTMGVSVLGPAEAAQAFADPEVRHIQLPISVLDRRWEAVRIPELAAGRPDVTIHARSLFLQGILAATPERWPRIPGVDPARILRTLDGLVDECGRNSRTDLCIAYVRALPWVTGLVLGMETGRQLEENIGLFRNPPLTPDQVVQVGKRLGVFPTTLLDPSQWTRP